MSLQFDTQYLSTQPASGPERVRKLLVMTFLKQDWEELVAMHAEAQQRIPDLTIDGFISALVADVLAVRRKNMKGEL